MHQNLLRSLGFALLLLTGTTMLLAQPKTSGEWKDDPRVDRLLSQLTLEEKIKQGRRFGRTG